MSIFGEIITGTAVRRAVETTVRLWIPTYLAEVARQENWDGPPLPDFQSYAVSTDIDRLAEDPLPCCIIVAPGLAEVPTREGTGVHRARWRVNVAAVVSGQSREGTMHLAEMYAAATRTLLLQHKSLGGFAEGVVWRNEFYDEVDVDDVRTLAIGVIETIVDVRGIVDSSQGPMAPLVDPTQDPGDWPTITSVTVDIEHRSVTE